MQEDNGGADMFPTEQYTVRQIQMFNWGTFAQLHRIPIAKKGQLIAGASGAGKSTVLDGMTTLLIPPKFVDFNAASQDRDRPKGADKKDRNLVAYVRGAWGVRSDMESGEFGLQYLRPDTTWSALALTFKNDIGRCLTLIQLFWIRGTSKLKVDIKRHYMIVEREVDLKELDTFALNDFNLKKLRLAFTGDHVHFDEFSRYSERFRHFFNIGSDSALRLLHKAQSMKNVGDLNAFLRDFMLDRPKTFDVAQSLVEEFEQLNGAHQVVLKARNQIATLLPAREFDMRRDNFLLRRNELDELKHYGGAYREWRRKSLLADYIKDKEASVSTLVSDLRTSDELLDREHAAHNELLARHLAAGGHRIVQAEAEQKAQEQLRDDRRVKRKLAEGACLALEWDMPESAATFSMLQGAAKDEMEQFAANGRASREDLISLSTQKNDVSAKFIDARLEVTSLEGRRSNIPTDMVFIRDGIAKALGMQDEDLPFAGELMEILPSERQWQGGIERVLGGFAVSMMVEERHHARVTAYVNANDLRRKLAYHRIVALSGGHARVMAVESLVRKIHVKDGPWAVWLDNELSTRFDYACVDSPAQLAKVSRGLTREGLVKHNATLNVKDDRRPVNDRSNWVLGFDNKEKLALYVALAQSLAAQISKLSGAIDKITDAEQGQIAKLTACQRLVDLQWHEIDVAPVLANLVRISKDLKCLREGDPVMKELSELIAEQKKKVKVAEDVKVDIRARCTVEQRDLDGRKRDLEAIEANSAIACPPPHQMSAFAACYTAQASALTLKNIDDVASKVALALQVDVAAMKEDVTLCETGIEKAFTAFSREWPMDAGSMDLTHAGVADFMAMLGRLQNDNLPAYEHEFFSMLNNQGHQKLVSLLTHMTQARKDIGENLDMVNESLSRSEYNVGTRMHIVVKDRHLKDVQDFMAEIKEGMANAMSDDRAMSEERFLILKRIVTRLSAQDKVSERWREIVLDSRQHVEFYGLETYADGSEKEVHQGGFGKSGGQKEKLATTILGAALRYQLSNGEPHKPVYAPVVLDEAFEKGDHIFAAQGMQIWANFGFQMIVATPLKAVMALEPFVEGASFVTIQNGKVSAVIDIPYEEASGRLQFPYDLDAI